MTHSHWGWLPGPAPCLFHLCNTPASLAAYLPPAPIVRIVGNWWHWSAQQHAAWLEEEHAKRPADTFLFLTNDAFQAKELQHSFECSRCEPEAPETQSTKPTEPC
jgi:hypothetical protein